MAPRVTMMSGSSFPGKIAQADGFSVEEERIDFSVVGEQFAELGLVAYPSGRGCCAAGRRGRARSMVFPVLMEPQKSSGE